MRTIFHWMLCCALLASAAGCNPDRGQTAIVAPAAQPTAPVAESAGANGPQPAPQAAKAAEELAAAGAKLERSTQNAITSVDLRGVEVVDALAGSLALLPKLEKLSMDRSAMTLEGWTLLSKLSSLQQLDLRDCPLNNEQLVAAVGGMPKLKALRLSGKSGQTTVDDAGLVVLKNCPELKALSIDDLWVTSDGIAHLLGNQKLAELYAGGTTIDDEATELLAKLPGLRKLRLSRTGIGAVALQALSGLALEELDISEASGITDESLEPVARIKSLKRLNLWRDTVSDSGVAHLAGLTNLEWLNLDNTHLSDDGLPHLAGLTKLTFLHLGSTGITDAGMASLTGLKSLRDLKVTRTAVTDAGVAVVTQAIPEVNVQLKYIEGE